MFLLEWLFDFIGDLFTSSGGSGGRVRKPSRLLREGTRATATVAAVEQARGLFGASQKWHLTLRVRPPDGQPYAAELKWEPVPPSHRHLVAPGSELPVAVDRSRRDRVAIDWHAAAEAAARDVPAAGIPTARRRAAAGQTLAVGGPMPSPIAAPVGDDSAHGVSFDTWVAVQVGLIRDRVPPARYDEYAQRHGVAAGTWAQAHAEWERRVRADWRLGARFGQAFEAERKRSGA